MNKEIKRPKSNSVKTTNSLLFKLSAIYALLLLVAILVMSVISVNSVENSSHDAAIIMANYKLNGDIESFQYMMESTYGQITLSNGDFVSEHGNSLKYDYTTIDRIARNVGVESTLFVREGQDFRRITTSLIDSSGNRLVDTLLGTGSAAYRNVISGEDYIGEVTILGEVYYAKYRPLLAPNSRDVTGILFIGIKMASIDEYITTFRTSKIITLVIQAFIILLAGIIINVITCKNMLLKPVQAVVDMLKFLEEGDLTHQVVVKTKDEIGVMKHSINHTLGRIKDMIKSIKKEARILHQIGTDLSSDMNESAAAVNEISANVQSIKTRILSQSASVSETHATMDQVVTNINKLNGHVENQSKNVSQASSAIEQMVANTRSVTESLVKNASNVKALREASEVGRAGLQDVAQDIQEIARESEGLMEINSVMQNIASQTNLLSMNAAIEAAHAGDVGKGFAVVADEIRKLAESSNEQSKTIGTVLKVIKDCIDKITKSTDNVLNKFEAIDTGVNIVVQQEENIRNAMEEQEIGSKQILQGIANVNEITQQVSSGSQEMLEGSKEVIRESEGLEKQTQEISSGIHEMASGAEQINIAINHINELSVKNRDNIALLLNEVTRFVVDEE